MKPRTYKDITAEEAQQIAKRIIDDLRNLRAQVAELCPHGTETDEHVARFDHTLDAAEDALDYLADLYTDFKCDDCGVIDESITVWSWSKYDNGLCEKCGEYDA